MAASAAEFLISIEQQLKGDDAASELQKAENAVRDGIAAYKQLEAATNKTAAQLEKVTTAAAGMRAKMEEAARANNPAAYARAATALEKLTQREQQLKTSVEEARAAMQKQQATVSAAAGNLDALRRASEKGRLASTLSTAKFGELAGAMGQLGGPLGGAAGRLLQFGDAMQKLAGSGGQMALVAGAAVAVVAVVALVVGAFVAATAAALKYAVSLADVARTHRLNVEALLESKEAAAEMSGVYRQLEKSTGATRDRLMAVTKQLKDAGIAGADMQTALRAIAMQEAAVGQDGTGKLIEDLKAGKTSAEALAKTVEQKYGGIVQDKMIGLDASVERLKGNFGALFSGLNIEPLLVAFSRFVDMFDETSSSGQTIKGLFETIFQPLADAAATVFPYVELFIVKFLNTILRIAVFMKPAIDKVGEFFGLEPNNTLETVMAAAEVAAIAVATAIGLVITIIAALVLGVISAGNAFLVKWNLAKTALDGIKNAVTAAKDKIAAIDLAQIGKDLINGFINGIKAGGKAVGEAVTAIGEDAKGALKAALGIKSPSTVFAELGAFTAEGYVRGIERETPSVSDAVTGMVSLAGDESRARPGRGGPVNVTVNLTVHGVHDADLISTLEKKAAELFRGLALELGTDAEEVPT